MMVLKMWDYGIGSVIIVSRSKLGPSHHTEKFVLAYK